MPTIRRIDVRAPSAEAVSAVHDALLATYPGASLHVYHDPSLTDQPISVEIDDDGKIVIVGEEHLAGESIREVVAGAVVAP